MLPSHRAKRLFDRQRPLYCRRELVEGDRTFQVGEPFPWEELGLRPEHALMLFRHRHVGHEQLVDEPPPDGVAPEAQVLTDADGRRLDGPTIEEWVAAGYLPEHYPPVGWAIKPSDGLRAWHARNAPGNETLIRLPWDEDVVVARRVGMQPAEPAVEAAAPESPASAATTAEPAAEEPATPAEPQVLVPEPGAVVPAAEPVTDLEPEPAAQLPPPPARKPARRR